MADKKMGRPAINKVEHRISVRLDEESEKILAEYVKQEKVDNSEAARRGIKKLAEDLK